MALVVPRGIEPAGIEPANVDHAANIINNQHRCSLNWQSPATLYAAASVR